MSGTNTELPPVLDGLQYMTAPLFSPTTNPSRQAMIALLAEFHVESAIWLIPLFHPDTAPLLKPTMKPVPSDALIGVPGATSCDTSTR